MDPLSVISSGVGIADVTIRLIKYLKEVKEATETIEDDIDRLISEVETLEAVHASVQGELEHHVQDDKLSPKENILWFQTGKTLQEGQIMTRKLDACVREIYGDNPKIQGKLDALVKQHRKRSRDKTLSDLRDQIHTYNGALQTWLNIISLCTASIRQDDTSGLLKQLSLAIVDLNKRIDDRASATPIESDNQRPPKHVEFHVTSINALEKLASAVTAVERSVTEERANKFFDTPQLVDRFYTGRDKEAHQLEDWLFQSRSSEDQQPRQRRFVIYGVGGSGKTQFCCKFANDHRERFWGVFWIDARNRTRLKQTLSENVARIAGVDANENAALHWLSNLESRWLLIIDNADDPAVDLDEYLPKGNRGYVLITTRNPSNRSYGNVGPEFFEFYGLDDDSASSLLLKAAGQSQPWDASLTKWSLKISSALGYLALAIAVAGASIREGFCQFHDYLDYHEERRQHRPSRARSKSQDRVSLTEDTRSGTVEATFDISYKAIAERDGEDARDALQLLRMFAFLHCENIRFEFLEKAVSNHCDELKQQAEDKKARDELNKTRHKPLSWSEWSNELLTAALRYLHQSSHLPVLPDVLRAGRKECRFNKLRVRAAMRQLTQCSLVMYNKDRDSYSMHPLVHEWAREAPDTILGEQGVCSEAAATFISCCILLPPLGTSTRDEEMRKDLLPHVDHVRAWQETIEHRIRDRRMARMKPWPVFEGGFNSERALMYAKFSIVYVQNGRWEDAKRLQKAVKEFTMKVLGLRHPTTRRIFLALAGTLWQLGESNDAAALQEQVFDACSEFLGPDHRDTLVAKQKLGESRYLQGRFSDALKLQEEAVAALQKHYGLHNEDTLSAIDYLGRTLVMFYTDEDLRRARSLHQCAVAGMRKIHGPEHLRTLIACEHLCTVAVRTADRIQLEEAHEMMIEVLRIRKVKLGKEHGHTLLAMANFALVKKALGDLTGAEGLLLVALPIAERNLGADHIAYLWGRYNLGLIYVDQRRWTEAESLYVDVTERQKFILQGRGRYHPDRIGGLVQLATVYNALGKYEERDAIAEEALSAFDVVSAREHPFARKLKADREVWKREQVEQVETR